MAGEYLSEIPEARSQVYNPAKCEEEGKQKPLVRGARRMAALERELLRKAMLLQGARHSGARGKVDWKGSAVRVSKAVEDYFRASALMPDIQLRCAPKVAACEKISLSFPVRVMRQAAKTLAKEGISLESAIHEGSTASSPTLLSKTIQRAAVKSGQVSRIIAKLPRATFDCAMQGENTVLPTVFSKEKT
jgi:hypothetical protein